MGAFSASSYLVFEFLFKISTLLDSTLGPSSHNGGYSFGPLFQTKLALFGSFFSGEVIVAKETAPGTQHVLPLSHFSLISSVAHFPHRFIPHWSEAYFNELVLTHRSLWDQCKIIFLSCSLFPTYHLFSLRSFPHKISIVVALHTLHF